jgi:hypothetical protein
MRMTRIFLALTVASLMVVGCANQKEPATKALASVEASLATFKDDAAKVAPEELAGVEATLTGLKESLAKGDYKAVLAGMPALTAAVDSLNVTVIAKKEQLAAAVAAANTEWKSLSTDVPAMVAAIQSRVDILSKSKKLPKKVDQAAFDSAKSGLESMKATWAEATAAFSSGDAVAAADKARQVKTQGADVLKMLGM